MREEVMLLISEIQKGSELTGRAKDDIPAVSAVAAIGTAPGNVLLPSEGNAAVSTVPGLDEYFDLIDKHKIRDGLRVDEIGRACLPDRRVRSGEAIRLRA
jgi:hypothetical protein